MLYLILLATVARADVVLDPPTVPDALASAEALAAAVAQAAGDPYSVPHLGFRFVVTVDGTEKVRRHHSWCPRAGLVEVDGVRISAVDGAPLGDTGAEAAGQAWAAFVNDGYWLLAPAKVLDPGVSRSVDEQGRLGLAFQGVGLTPGDRYWLTVQPDTYRVTRWDYVLQSGREGSFAWEDYQQHGPLSLSTRRTATQGDATIRFEDLTVGQACPLTPR